MRSFSAAALVLLAGCTASKDGGGATCPLDGTERQIVEEVVFEIILNAATASQHNVGSERAWGLSLPASTIGNNGFLFDVAPCTTTTSLAPYCFAALEPDPPNPFFVAHDTCVRLSCEQADVALLDAYFTLQPQQLPEPRHEFGYETDQPPGTAVFAENPWLRYRVELLDSASNIVTADLNFDVTILPNDHAEIPFRHEGTLLAENTDLDVHRIELDMTFPDLAGGLDATFTLGSGGSIAAGTDVLATIFDEPQPFAWRAGCDG